MTTVQRVCPQCGVTFECDGPSSRRRKYCTKLCLSRSKLPYCRARHAVKRDEDLAKMRAYYARNREKRMAQMNATFQATRLTSPWRNIMAGAKNRAKVGNFAFDIDDAWAKARWTGKCEISGIPFQLGLKPEDKRMFAASIDRVRPDLGYTKSNCRFILFAINAMKQNGTDDEVRAMVKSMYESKWFIT